jgi:hypothetical protein
MPLSHNHYYYAQQAAYVKRGHMAGALENSNAVFTISYRTSRKGKAAAKSSSKGKGKAKGIVTFI